MVGPIERETVFKYAEGTRFPLNLFYIVFRPLQWASTQRCAKTLAHFAIETADPGYNIHSNGRLIGIHCSGSSWNSE